MIPFHTLNTAKKWIKHTVLCVRCFPLDLVERKVTLLGANKQGKLLQHVSCNSHHAALADLVAQFSIESCHVDVLMSTKLKNILFQEKADEEKNKEIMAILVDVAKTLAKQSLAFRGSGKNENGNYIQIVNLLSRHCPVSKSWLENQRLKPYRTTYTSSESPNEIVHLLAQDVRKRIRDESTTVLLLVFTLCLLNHSRYLKSRQTSCCRKICRFCWCPT